MFKPLKIQVLVNRPRSIKGEPFEFGLGSILAHEMGSSIEGSKNPATQPNTPKSMEKVIAKVMQVDKLAELFKTMAIVNLNMGNLNLELNNLKNTLAREEKEKVVLHVELDKERDF